MKKRIKAAIISAFIPGGGQLYRKRFLSGIIFLLIFTGAILFLLLIWNEFHNAFYIILLSFIVLWFSNIVDAYKGPYFFRAPCDIYCPADLNPSKYILLLSDNKIKEAYREIHDKVPFVGTLGRICPAPCEPPCSRSGIDDSIQIRYLKRIIFDEQVKSHQSNQINSIKKRKVAVVGGGISGCTCAYQLRKKGYEVTVFEKEKKAGGMPYYGIPDYRLPGDVIEREISLIESSGVRIKTDTEVGKDITFKEIRSNFDAVFLATGTHLCSQLEMGEKELEMVYYGLPFLKSIKKEEAYRIGKNVIVIGGGNVAIDAARSAVRLGSRVRIACLEEIDEMPAFDFKVKKSLEEGINFMYGWGVKEITGKDRVEKVKLKKCTRAYDSSGNLNPLFDENIVTEVKCDTMIICIGQVPETDYIPGEILSSDNEINVNRRLSTPLPGVFAGGDMLQPKIAAEAAADGLNAARNIDIYLRGFRARFENLLSYNDYPLPEHEIVSNPEKEEKLEIPVEENIESFNEIEGQCSLKESIREAGRCLNCPHRFGGF